MVPLTATGPFRFDLDTLLLPISADSPSGENLRYEGVYDEIRSARTEDDPVLMQGIWKTPLRKADWGKVEELCIEALRGRSKDLQVAAWLLESWVHLHSFAGLHEGFRLLTGLCEGFWDTLYPEIQDGDIEFRLGPIEWLNEKVPFVLKLLPVTAPSSEDSRPYCWADWESVNRRNQPEPAASETNGNTRVTQVRFQQSAMMTPTSFLRDLRLELEAATDAVTELEVALEARLGMPAPSLRQFFSTLESIRGLVRSLLSQRGPEAASSAPVQEKEMTPQEPNDRAGNEPAPNWSGPIRSRADAYLRLAEAAEYLERTEPHSPAPYLIKRAIAWGGMRLEHLLPELVRNSSDLEEIFRLLKISKPKGS